MTMAGCAARKPVVVERQQFMQATAPTAQQSQSWRHCERVNGAGDNQRTRSFVCVDTDNVLWSVRVTGPDDGVARFTDEPCKAVVANQVENK